MAEKTSLGRRLLEGWGAIAGRFGFSQTLMASGGPPGTERFFVGRVAPYTTLRYASWFYQGVCDNQSGEHVEMIPADEVSLTDLGLSFPLPGPLHIAPGAP